MHELSIALSIVDGAREEAERHQPSQVTAVHLKLGRLSGVVKEALLSSYELACEDTPLAGSRLVIEELPVMIYCSRCRQRRVLESLDRFCCDVCSTPSAEVVQGREIQLSALELQE